MTHRSHEIDPRTTMITFELNGWGRFLYDRELASSEAQVAFQRRINDERGRPGQGSGPRQLIVPLWEAMALYGPHVSSSFRLPFPSRFVGVESAAERVREYVAAEVSRIPDAPGQWWYGDEVLTVEGAAPDPGTSTGLVVCLRNNRRKRVVDMDPEPWLGPARRDARIPKFGYASPSSDEDIPF